MGRRKAGDREYSSIMQNPSPARRYQGIGTYTHKVLYVPPELLNTRRSQFTPVVKAKIRTMDKTKTWKGCGNMETHGPCWWEYEPSQPFLKISQQHFAVFACVCPMTHTVPLLGTKPREGLTQGPWAHRGGCVPQD